MATLYPPVSFYFRVEFQLGGGNTADTQFQDVSGISASLETQPVIQGGENRYTQELPKRAKYEHLVLKRGMLAGSELIKWCRDAIENLDITPVSVIVTLLNSQGEPLFAYNFVNAWPIKWVTDGFDAQQSKIAVETIELSYQYFKLV